MEYPLDLGLKRATLSNYPNIFGVFLLLRTLHLVLRVEKRVFVDSAKLQEWLSLNATEQYFTLFEAWLWRADPGWLDERVTSYRCQATERVSNIGFLTEMPKSSWKTFPEYVHTDSGALKSVLGPCSPNYENVWFPSAVEVVPGSYVFKFEPDPRMNEQPFHRVVRIDGEFSLGDLVRAFLGSIDFDTSEHFFVTYSGAKNGRMECEGGFWSTCEVIPDAGGILVKEADLAVGTHLSLVYERRRGWRFKAKLLRIDPPNDAPKNPEIIDSQGPAPLQYAAYE